VVVVDVVVVGAVVLVSVAPLLLVPTAYAVTPPIARKARPAAIVVLILRMKVSSKVGWCAAHYAKSPGKSRASRGKASDNRGGSEARWLRFSTMSAPPDLPVVLLVEDEASIAEPFARALQREGLRPVVAATAAAARELFVSRRPNIVLLDLSLPDGDGRELCREWRRDSQVPIIMLTARGTETDRVVGLELGADDYVVKPFSAAEVAARIRAVLRRAAPDRTTQLERTTIGELTIDPATRSATLAGEELGLTRKEFDLLARLAREPGTVVSREDLMADVWDENWFGSTKTLDVHIGFLRRKLGDAAAAPRYLRTVRGVGFRLAAPEDADR
jgi:DNA-binding response OmpR family regulator